MIGGLYAKGKTLMDKENYDEAEKVFRRGIDAGDPKCVYGNLALHANKGADISECIDEMREAFPKIVQMCKDSDKEAEFIVGRCYEMGISVEKKIELAIKYYLRSADKNYTDAMFNLGCVYLNCGLTLEKVAEGFFLPAAKLGNANACFALGYYYENLGDKKKELLWYKKAAEYGTQQMKNKYMEKRNIYNGTDD